jgi:hypothetical protein
MMKKFVLAALVMVASAVPSFAQGAKVVDVIVEPKFVQGSCVTMMKGWENGNNIDQPATIETGVKNESKHRMLVLTKNKAGQIWSVADLAPGESRNFRVNEGTNFAWALAGGHHKCIRGFSLANGSTDTFK